MEKDLSSAATAYDLLRAKLFSPLGSSSHVDTSNIEEDFKVLPESRKIAFKCVNEIKNYSCLYLFNFHKYLTPSPFSDKSHIIIIDFFFFLQITVQYMICFRGPSFMERGIPYSLSVPEAVASHG